MGSYLIVTATELEMASILEGKHPFKQGKVFSIKKIHYLITGIGIINSAIFLTKALLETRVDGVINMGIAGSFDEAVFPVKSVALVEEEIWGEFGVKENKILSCKKLRIPLGNLEKEKVWNRLKLFPETTQKILKLTINGCKRAKSLTVSTVTGDYEDAKFFKNKFKVDIENMEGFALAWVCKLMKIPFLEIRVISNIVGPKRKITWDLKGSLKTLSEFSKRLFLYHE